MSERQVLVIEKDLLFSLIGQQFQGFFPLPPSIVRVLEKNALWLDKARAEKDPRYKQLIGYTSVVNPKGKIFAYQRASTDLAYEERRLQGKWSVGIGGHIEPIKSLEIIGAIPANTVREIYEEIRFRGLISDNLRLAGGINYDDDEVSQVHFGLWMVLTIEGEAKPKDKEIAFGEMRPMAGLVPASLGANVEPWTSICLQNLNQLV